MLRLEECPPCPHLSSHCIPKNCHRMSEVIHPSISHGLQNVEDHMCRLASASLRKLERQKRAEVREKDSGSSSGTTRWRACVRACAGQFSAVRSSWLCHQPAASCDGEGENFSSLVNHLLRRVRIGERL